MAIINRDMAHSTRKREIQSSLASMATGVTTVMGEISLNGLVNSCYASAFGLSGTPTVSFSLYRFTSTGFTAIGLAATITIPAYGTSGIAAATLISGVTCLQGDLLVALSGGSNAATVATVLGGVFTPQDDILKFPGA